jgi:DNA-binding XRE family transcriptional regulator
MSYNNLTATRHDGLLTCSASPELVIMSEPDRQRSTMILRKLRIQKGWSQEQLAELTGLSVRTIQRIERGAQASLESANALAAVFQVEVATFIQPTGDEPMTSTEHDNPIEHSQSSQPTVSKAEKAAINYVKGIKEFYGHLFMFVVFMLAFLVTGKFAHPQMGWLILGWVAGLIIHGLVAFEIFGSFGTNWEKKQIEKKLGRKL